MVTRCGVIAIVGEPNAGKSTLINHLVGGKVSIVTPKVQTTRFNIRGVCITGRNDQQAQLIFVDTPGIFNAEKSFEKAMVQAAWSGIGDADAVLLMVDAKHAHKESTRELIGALAKNCKKPVCLAINKIDTIERSRLIELAQALSALMAFEKIFMISALKGDGTEDVSYYLASMMPQGPFLYPQDQMSDISMRLLAAEVTREKIFLKLDQELPYAVFVETESWDEKDTAVTIAQVITVQREGQKKIIIGAKGEMIKRIGIASRRELEKMLDKRVHLNMFVKVRANWKDDSENYRLLGLEYRVRD
jgi:GTP-binding protein Era